MQRRTVLLTGAAALTVMFLPRDAEARCDTTGAHAILEAVGAARRRARSPDLAPVSALCKMARRQSIRMWDLGATTHIGADGSDPIARARQAGYSGQLLGETLARTYDGPVETADLWLAHDRTRAVLLDPRVRDVGIFGLRERTGLVWWDFVVGTCRMPEPGGQAEPSLH